MPPETRPDREARRLAGSDLGRWLVPVVYVLCAVAFINDLLRANTLAYGIIYVPLVASAVFHRRHWGLWVLVALTSLLVVVGAFLPFVNADLPDLVGNRILSIAAILATAAFVRHARQIQDRLAEQTARAEQAERIKAEVLSNLSQEMRTPLHKLLGLLSLMMIECRPSQREALGRVRAGGQQLLATIDNLVDLAQIDDLSVQRHEVDVTRILRDAGDSARQVAQEDGITITVSDGTAAVKAVGDAWATRRILDNLIANAVRFTPPGGTVLLSAHRDRQQVIASVSDTGSGLPPRLAHSLDAVSADSNGLASPASSGAGLTLSNRLARAMNGSLLLESRPGEGARVSLRLPAAIDHAA